MENTITLTTPRNVVTASRIKLPGGADIRLFPSVYKLIAKQFFKGGGGPVFVFLFPILILALMGFILGSQRGSIVSGITSFSIMGLAIFGLPSSIADFRSSVLLKRIGATPVKPWMFIFSVITFYMAMSLVSVLWALTWIAMLWPAEAPGRFAAVDWGSFIFAFVWTLIMASTIGMTIASLGKTSNAVQTIAMFVSMSANFLGGQFIPLSLINNNQVLSVISHFVPFRYTVTMFNQAFAGGQNVFEGFGSDYYQVLTSVADPSAPNGTRVLSALSFANYDRWLNIFLPVAITAVCFVVSAKKFRWSSR